MAVTNPGISRKQPGRPWTDQRVEQLMGNLLRVGVIVATVVIIAGGLLYLAQNWSTAPNYKVFRGENTELKTVDGIVNGAFGLDGAAVIQFGLLLLIATPLARVVFSVVAFALEHDWTYVVITLVVLAILAYSILHVV